MVILIVLLQFFNHIFVRRFRVQIWLQGNFLIMNDFAARGCGGF
jgi:hypothetical protein